MRGHYLSLSFHCMCCTIEMRILIPMVQHIHKYLLQQYQMQSVSESIIYKGKVMS